MGKPIDPVLQHGHSLDPKQIYGCRISQARQKSDCREVKPVYIKKNQVILEGVGIVYSVSDEYQQL